MAEVATYPLGVVVLVGVIALAVGILIGTLVRGSARTKTVLAARRAWATANLRTIFGIGRDAADAGGRVGRAVAAAAAPCRLGAQLAVQLAGVPAGAGRHPPRLAAHAREGGRARRPAWVEAGQEWVRRVHRVENTLTHWAAGRWLTHSSLRLRITNRKPFWNRRLQRSLLIPSAPEAVLRGEYPPCDCETGQAPAG
ncbi:hypothetical protein [Leifsonia aquatica]|uniref:hypothetical protein n=1 Tax=Leifsonia aquatica TaxID=144185 RepID=UPI0028A6B2DE|nr:hypothetical protein [Leifsonia aquatica]